MSFLMRKARGAAITVGIGALTSYFLDPQLGRQRRQALTGRVTGLIANVRDERATAERSAHGDGDPTGGALPSEPMPFEPMPAEPMPAEPIPADLSPSDVLPTPPGPTNRSATARAR